ncbi:MAG: hypothetical protein WD733_24805 [Bryobacterales bacterium]
MPYAQTQSGRQGGVLYNVEQSVGASSANVSGDVRLVQYMLKGIYKTGEIAVDGFIGPVTLKWIKQFQTDMKNAGNNVLVDGRIDRAFGKVASVSKTVYGIILLNLHLKQFNPSAYAVLPQNVPLSTTPKANPYNPTPDKNMTMYVVNGNKVTVIYSDGSEEIYVVEGSFVVDGVVIKP